MRLADKVYRLFAHWIRSAPEVLAFVDAHALPHMEKDWYAMQPSDMLEEEFSESLWDYWISAEHSIFLTRRAFDNFAYWVWAGWHDNWVTVDNLFELEIELTENCLLGE